MDRSRRPAILAAALALAMTFTLVFPPAMSSAVAAADGEDATRLPTDIALNSDASVRKYEQDGRVHTGTFAPEMEIAIADSREDVGLTRFTANPLKGSARNKFIRIEHHEDMTRTVQVPVRSDYWTPFPREDLDSLNSDHTADLTTVKRDGREYTVITVRVSGNDSAVFPVPVDAQAVYTAASNTENRTNSTFGIDLGLTATPWNRVPDTVFTNETAVRIEGNPDKIMVQYNAGTPNDPNWLMVPDKPTRTDPMYLMRKDGVENAVYVVSENSDPPAVRYKERTTWGDNVGVWIREAKSLGDRITDGIGIDIPSLFGSITTTVSSEVAG